jgi:putative tryptophan/tyrosine transport system substrate-binding protein
MIGRHGEELRCLSIEQAGVRSSRVSAAWPLAAHAQRRMPRIAVLLNFTKQTGEQLLAAMLEQLRQVGWVQGETARFDIRWGDGEADHIHKAAADLVALAPDIIVTSSTPPTLVFLEMTRAIPIVFGSIVDPSDQELLKACRGPAAM